MQAVLLWVDRINTWIGQAFAWSIIALTLVVSYEIVMRTLFRAPTGWAFDWSYILYGTLFMMAGAYTLARNGHVRGDFLYRNFPIKVQAALDMLLYFLFFFPGILAFMYFGYKFAHLSWLINERSMFSPSGPLLWPFKALIPLAGATLLAQGIAEVVRCAITIRTGVWPERLHDVEETEKLILEQAQAQAEADARTARGVSQ